MKITVAGNKKEYEDGITVAELIVKENVENPEYVTGRLDNNAVVHFPGTKDMIGGLYNVRLNECKGFYYIGEIVND